MANFVHQAALCNCSPSSFVKDLTVTCQGEPGSLPCCGVAGSSETEGECLVQGVIRFPHNRTTRQPREIPISLSPTAHQSPPHTRGSIPCRHMVIGAGCCTDAMRTVGRTEVPGEGAKPAGPIPGQCWLQASQPGKGGSLCRGDPCRSPWMG